MTDRDAHRREIVSKWREWALEDGATEEEARLRSVIGAAYLRLTRLDNSNREVCHARELLECAMTREPATWP